MSQIELALKSIDLIKDWTLWITGIQTASIAAVAMLLASGRNPGWNKWAFFSMFAFAMSIFTAGGTMMALPSITMRLTEVTNANVYSMDVFDFLPIPLWIVLVYQYLWFQIAVIVFLVFVFFRSGGEVKIQP